MLLNKNLICLDKPANFEMRYTIAFYNLENFFDYRSDRQIFNDGALPHSDKGWTKNRYWKKMDKIGLVISQIGESSSSRPPAVIGVAEVENKQVLQDLVNCKWLNKFNYRYVHYTSMDKRGVDVALLYRPEILSFKNSKTYKIELRDHQGVENYTRDILLVEGIINSESIYFLINHWPSRRDGVPISEPKRMYAASTVKDIVIDIKDKEPKAKIVVMGDFNDNPSNNSLRYLENKLQLYNPMARLKSFTKGSLNYGGQWNLFDQILFSNNLLSSTKGKLQFENAGIFDLPFLKQSKGRFKGRPHRTFIGDKYQGGYSDHFPIYITLGF